MKVTIYPPVEIDVDNNDSSKCLTSCRFRDMLNTSTKSTPFCFLFLEKDPINFLYIAVILKDGKRCQQCIKAEKKGGKK